MQYLQPIDKMIAKMVKAFKSIEKYRTKVVPAKKHKKALKIFKKFVKGNEHVPKALQTQLAEQVENFDFAAANMFMPLEEHLVQFYQKHYDDFYKSPMFTQLQACTGPKMVTVSKEKGADAKYKLHGSVYVGRSRENDAGEGYIQLEDDHKVSREHCRFDAGPLAVMITDLGSSKGTRLDGKDGKKIMTKIILPGQSIFIGPRARAATACAVDMLAAAPADAAAIRAHCRVLRVPRRVCRGRRLCAHLPAGRRAHGGQEEGWHVQWDVWQEEEVRCRPANRAGTLPPLEPIDRNRPLEPETLPRAPSRSAASACRRLLSEGWCFGLRWFR